VRRLVLVVATVGGVGYVPVAPGTAGTLVALPLLPVLGAVGARSLGTELGIVAAIVALAVWAAGRAEAILAQPDSPRIVVDEVAGLAVAGLFVPVTWRGVGLAFVLFRVFDVLKPFPAGLVDARLEGGLGVVGDDVVAGVYAGLAARLVLEVL